MSKKSKGASKAPGIGTVDPDALIARAPSHRWQRGCEPEEVHLDPDSKRRTQRVHDAVRSLERSGRIGGAHVSAATRWTRDYEWNLRSSFIDPVTASIRGGGGNSGPEMRLAAGVDASTRYAEAARAVGLVGDAMLRAVCADGCSLRELGRRRGLSDGGRATGRIADEFAAVLEMLADHYQSCDRHGYAGILDPRRRPAKRNADGQNALAA